MNEEYIRKQAVLERLRPFDHKHADLEHGDEHFINGVETAIEVIEDTPAADVAEVVRCKNCKWFRKWKDEKNSYYCAKDNIAILGNLKPNFYCGYGKRRKDNDKRMPDET